MRRQKLSKPRKQNSKKPFISEENKKNKDRIIRDIRIVFETEEENEERKQQEQFYDQTFLEQEEDYYKSKRVCSFWNNNYIEYESNGDKNSNLSLGEYLNNIKSYVKYIIMEFRYMEKSVNSCN